MGAIVGAAIVSHVPTLVMPEAERIALNGGTDITLVDGLRRLRTECLDRLAPDTVVVIDTHWFTTFEFVVAAHARREGRYTSDELPRGMSAMPYALDGDPELAHAMAAAATQQGDTWITAIDDPYLPIHYPTVNLLPFLQGAERWVSVSICQTAQPDDFLACGRALAAAVESLDRNVVVLASGGLSHAFWPLRELRAHETSHVDDIRTYEARAADEKVLKQLARGDHRVVLGGIDSYLQHKPEGRFGHYLTMLGAIGGHLCRAPGTPYSAYEAAAGTGQAHLWFERPERGWT